MLPIILCLFEGLNDLRLVYNDCEKIYFITFEKVGVAIYNDHTVLPLSEKKIVHSTANMYVVNCEI